MRKVTSSVPGNQTGRFLELKDYSLALLSENRVLSCVLVCTSMHGHYLQLCLNLQLTPWVDIIP